MNDKGFSLYAKPSFLEGVARLVDIAGTLDEYNYSDSDDEADSRALQSDWEAVGNDLHSALETLRKQVGTNKPSKR